MKQYTTSVVKEIDPSLAEQWKELWKTAENANPFNSYEWFLTFLQTHKDASYELYVCYQNEQLVAILPLQQATMFGVPVLSSLFNEHLIDTPFLMKTYDRELFAVFFEKVFQNRNIFIQKVDSKAATHLQKSFPSLFFSLMSVNPTVDVTNDPMQKASRSTVKQIRKIIRQNPGLRFVMYDNKLPEHLQSMMALEAKSSKKQRAMDIFSKQEVREFFQSMVEHAKQITRIYFLYLHDTPIAYQYGYFYRDIFVCDQTAYRQEYAKIRPGKLLLHHLFNDIKKENGKLVDLGGGISTYKTEFTDEYRTLYNVYYSPNVFNMWWWKCINLLRRAKQLLFKTKNTRDYEFLFKKL